MPEATGYNIYRRTTGQAFTRIAENVVTGYATYLDRTVTDGTTYYYVVRWLSFDGQESPDSNEVSAQPVSRRSRTR